MKKKINYNFDYTIIKKRKKDLSKKKKYAFRVTKKSQKEQF